MSNFAERMKWAMNRAGLGQSELARRVGMRQSSISHLLKPGTQGSGKTLQIARALGVNPDWLATGNGDRLAPEAVTKAYSRDLAELDALALEGALEAIDELEKHFTIPADKRARAILAVQNTARKMIASLHKKG